VPLTMIQHGRLRVGFEGMEAAHALQQFLEIE